MHRIVKRLEELTKMTNIQNTHRHPAAAAKKLPAMGPTAGPSKNPIEYIDIAKPLRWIGTRSEIVPPALLIELEAQQPCRNRSTTSPLREGTKAHPIENALNPMFAQLYTTWRPTTSDIGPIRMGPTPVPRSWSGWILAVHSDIQRIFARILLRLSRSRFQSLHYSSGTP